MEVQNLVSLPPAMAAQFAAVSGRQEPCWVAACDPPGGKLGSGGGIAHLLVESWRRTGDGAAWEDWLGASQKLLLMAGGQSRRLPAYAPGGKLTIPMPVLRWAVGQDLEQTLLDLQTPSYEAVLRQAGPGYRALVTSGDVLLRFDHHLPALPDVDVLGFGMWVRPEVAGHFGVFFSPRHDPRQWAFFRQKPKAEEIRQLAAEHFYLVDTGMWLLSARAVEVLLRKCGWDPERGAFRGGVAETFELYAEFGLALGTSPQVVDPEISNLRAAVLPLTDAEFYHLGTSRQLIESVSALQNLQLDQTKLGGQATRPHPDQYILNSDFSYPRRLEQNHTLWVESSCVPATWHLEHDHFITGVPGNEWALRLEAGVCLDIVPVGEAEWAVRVYGMEDPFRGRLDAEETLWLGRPFPQWLTSRGLDCATAGLEAGADLQEAPLFPVLPWEEVTPELIEWLSASSPDPDAAARTTWLRAKRLSAEDICTQFSPRRAQALRRDFLGRALPALAANHRFNPFYRLDLARTAQAFAQASLDLVDLPAEPDGLAGVHDAMFRAEVLRRKGAGDWAKWESVAFARLRELIVQAEELPPTLPQRKVLEDQIIWGRSPVRLDLAGGWSDTPPYCLEHGGKVVNLAVNLNGQPPIQVFARGTEVPELVVRSIDLGVECRIRHYGDLADFARPDSEFALAKAALALAGFLPQFHAEGGEQTLQRQLEKFGGGMEVTLLAAVPKGSGLGTSSILAATLLGVLSDFCGLGWDSTQLFARTMALEQLLTTGGGWQDQVGGITRGIKLIETAPGLAQTPVLKWLPEHLFAGDAANRRILLYYTGLTRMAKNLLQEIVRGMFLNRRGHLEILRQISEHAVETYECLQSGDYHQLCRAVDRTWQLKQALDAGTNPPAVAEILTRVQPWLAAAKLPGAGGGGYLFMLARDEEAASRIRRELEKNPPNPRARFVEFSLSDLGLQITRS